MAVSKFVCFQAGYFYAEQISSQSEVLRFYRHDRAGPRMVFERIRIDGDLHIYRGYNNRYLRVDDAGPDPWHIYCDGLDASAASAFREIWFPDDQVGFVYRGLFASFDGTTYGEDYANFMVSSAEAGGNQMFWLEVAPAELIPKNVGSTAEKLVVEDLPAESRAVLDPVRPPPHVPVEARVEAITTDQALDPDRFRPLER